MLSRPWISVAAVATLFILGACAPAAQTQVDPSTLDCQELRVEITRTESIIEEAKGRQGLSGENIVWALFFLPGAFINNASAADIQAKAEERLLTLRGFYDTKNCSAPAPTTVPIQAPTVVYTRSLGADAFTATLGDEPIERVGEGYSITKSGLMIGLLLDRDSIIITLSNMTESTVRFIPDESAFVIGGRSSPLVTGSVSWTTRLDPQRPIIIPADSIMTEVLFPLDNLSFDRRLSISNMFEWPIERPTRIGLLLMIETNGIREEYNITFQTNP